MALAADVNTYMVEPVANYDRIAKATKEPSKLDRVKKILSYAPWYTIGYNLIRAAINIFIFDTPIIPDFDDPTSWVRELGENATLVGLETAPKIGELAINSENPKKKYAGLGLTIAGKVLFPIYAFGVGANYSPPTTFPGGEYFKWMNFSSRAFSLTTIGNVYMTAEAIKQKNPGLLLPPLLSAPTYLGWIWNNFGVTGGDILRYGFVSEEIGQILFPNGSLYLLSGSMAADSVANFTEGKVKEGAKTAKGVLSLAAAVSVLADNLIKFGSKVGTAASYENQMNDLREQQEAYTEGVDPEWQALQDQINVLYKAYNPLREELIENVVHSTIGGIGVGMNYKTIDQIYHLVHKVEESEIQNFKQVGPNTVLLTPVESGDYKKLEHDSLETNLSMVDICEAWDLLYKESKSIKDLVAGKDLYLNVNVAFKDPETEEQFEKLCEDLDKLLKPNSLHATLNASAARARRIVVEEDKDADLLADYDIWCAGYSNEGGNLVGSSKSELCKIEDDQLVSGFLKAIHSFAIEATGGGLKKIEVEGVTCKKYTREKLELTPVIWYASKAENLGLFEILFEEMAKDMKERSKIVGTFNGAIEQYEGMPVLSLKKAITKYKSYLEFCEFWQGVLAPEPASIKNGDPKALKFVAEQIEKLKNSEPDEAKRAYDRYRGIDVKEPGKKYIEIRIPVEDVGKIAKKELEGKITSLLREPDKLKKKLSSQVSPEEEKLKEKADTIYREFEGLVYSFESKLREFEVLKDPAKKKDRFETLKKTRTQLLEMKKEYITLREKLYNEFDSPTKPIFEIEPLPESPQVPKPQYPIDESPLVSKAPTPLKLPQMPKSSKPIELPGLPKIPEVPKITYATVIERIRSGQDVDPNNLMYKKLQEIKVIIEDKIPTNITPLKAKVTRALKDGKLTKGEYNEIYEALDYKALEVEKQ
jgi:hypothetical protein